MESIAAGAAVGLIECAVCQPFDMVKTRHHLSSQARSVASSLQAIHAEGGFRRFYRGVGPEFAGMVPKSAAMYSSYDGARQLLLAHTSLDEVAASVAAGAASGPFEAAVVQPFQVVKVRMQTKEYVGRYAGSLDCAARETRDAEHRSQARRHPPLVASCHAAHTQHSRARPSQGCDHISRPPRPSEPSCRRRCCARRAWRPLRAPALAPQCGGVAAHQALRAGPSTRWCRTVARPRPPPRNSVWNAAYFGSMAAVRRRGDAAGGRAAGGGGSEAAARGLDLVAGFGCGVLATCFNAPFDVAKSRIQSQLPAATAGATGDSHRHYHGTLSTLARIAREEGLAACWKGFQAKAIRMGLAGLVGLSSFDLVKWLLV